MMAFVESVQYGNTIALRCIMILTYPLVCMRALARSRSVNHHQSAN